MKCHQVQPAWKFITLSQRGRGEMGIFAASRRESRQAEEPQTDWERRTSPFSSITEVERRLNLPLNPIPHQCKRLSESSRLRNHSISFSLSRWHRAAAEIAWRRVKGSRSEMEWREGGGRSVMRISPVWAIKRQARDRWSDLGKDISRLPQPTSCHPSANKSPPRHSTNKTNPVHPATSSRVLAISEFEDGVGLGRRREWNQSL